MRTCGGRTSINNRYKKIIERKGHDGIGGRMMQIEITLLIAMLGGFVGLAGWLSGRDKRISRDSEWRGR